MHAKASLTYR